ncbi:tRNAse Z1 [Klebsormidium nitens]|uniref:tRNAse Z1 n=1 Tax=Klebsormidium nitens TaxID=105231 RepID=A0A0U9HQI1_KLENI|nr:tRNAse Z1 [Klebsormidium nitens]|eukprot:GAQ80583.1 tRNAse Z1 [Klebsormidium nitens]
METSRQDIGEGEKEVKTGRTPPSASEDVSSEALGHAVPQVKEKRKGKAEGANSTEEGASTSNLHNRGDLSTITVGGVTLQGVSVGGQETCIIIPSMKVAFDVGRCPQRAVFQDNVLISHAHMDHIGGVCLQAATRGLFSLKPPRIVVPKVIVPGVENLFNAFRALDNAELEHKLIGLEIGEELRLSGELFVKPFRTYHVVPSQGYVVYSRRQKLKKEFVGLPGPEIGRLRKSGVEITDVEEVPEVAFTGDTTAEFLTDPGNADVLRAKLLIMEMTFIDDSSTVEHARKWGHTHIDEVVPLAHLFQNEAILFIHFSARYRRKDILEAIERLPPGFREKVTPLLERF